MLRQDTVSNYIYILTLCLWLICPFSSKPPKDRKKHVEVVGNVDTLWYDMGAPLQQDVRNASYWLTKGG